MNPRSTIAILVSRIAIPVLTLAVGFFLANWWYSYRAHLTTEQSTEHFLQHLQNVAQGKLTLGTYFIPTAPGRAPLTLEIAGDGDTGVVREIFIDNGVNTASCHFSYQPSSDYGVPIAALLTGSRKDSHSWIDIGLNGRFLIKAASGVPPRVYLGGQWVEDFRESGSVLEHGGKRYRYNRSTGDFELIVPESETTPAGGTP
jgi:hypothetical protein